MSINIVGLIGIKARLLGQLQAQQAEGGRISHRAGAEFGLYDAPVGSRDQRKK